VAPQARDGREAAAAAAPSASAGRRTPRAACRRWGLAQGPPPLALSTLTRLLPDPHHRRPKDPRCALRRSGAPSRHPLRRARLAPSLRASCVPTASAGKESARMTARRCGAALQATRVPPTPRLRCHAPARTLRYACTLHLHRPPTPRTERERLGPLPTRRSGTERSSVMLPPLRGRADGRPGEMRSGSAHAAPPCAAPPRRARVWADRAGIPIWHRSLCGTAPHSSARCSTSPECGTGRAYRAQRPEHAARRAPAPREPSPHPFTGANGASLR
jgi:hypothetical protein